MVLSSSYSLAEILHGLIGVGLIHVDDRSGILSLDKGETGSDFKPCQIKLKSIRLYDSFLSSSPDYNNIGKFLNRILGMAVQEQNALFQYFSDTLAAVIQNAKKNGRYDMGILGKAGEE